MHGRRKVWYGVVFLRLAGFGLGALALAFFTFVLARASWGMYGKYTEAGKADAAAAQELTQLQEKHARLEADVRALATPRGLEAEVRERFGVAKPGEGEIKIIRDDAQQEALEAMEEGFWSRLWPF